MDKVTGLLDTFSGLSMEQLGALIALGAMALSAFAIYAVLSVVKGRKG